MARLRDAEGARSSIKEKNTTTMASLYDDLVFQKTPLPNFESPARSAFGLISGVIGNLLQPELVDLIAKRDFAQLRAILCDFTPLDLAEIFFDLKPDDEAVLLRILPNDIAAQVFEYL